MAEVSPRVPAPTARKRRAAAQLVGPGCVKKAPEAATREEITDKQLLLRIPVFLGIILLLYTLATGLWLQYSGQLIEPGAIRQHSIVGILGSALCITTIFISVWKRAK